MTSIYPEIYALLANLEIRPLHGSPAFFLPLLLRSRKIRPCVRYWPLAIPVQGLTLL